MKTIFTAGNGAVTLVEDQGVVTLKLAKQESVGGGQAAGILKVDGAGSIVFDGMTGLMLGEALLNSHIPANAQPLASVVEGVANQAIRALL